MSRAGSGILQIVLPVVYRQVLAMYSEFFQINSSPLSAFWKAEFLLPLQSPSAGLLHFCFMFCFLSMKTWILRLKASLRFVNSKRISPLTSTSYEQRWLPEASSTCIIFSLLTLNKEEGRSDLWRCRKSVLKGNKYDFKWSLWVWWFPVPGSTCLFPVWSPGKFLKISQWRFTIGGFCLVSQTSGPKKRIVITSVSIPANYCVG